MKSELKFGASLRLDKLRSKGEHFPSGNTLGMKSSLITHQEAIIRMERHPEELQVYISVINVIARRFSNDDDNNNNSSSSNYHVTYDRCASPRVELDHSQLDADELE